MRLQDYNIQKRYKAILLENHRITAEAAAEEVRELRFEIEEPEFQYHIGQCIGVLVPGPHEFGHEFHFRLYTIADIPVPGSAKPKITICVKRCFYIDDYSGEHYQGIASNFLCGLKKGQQIILTGPYDLPFTIPDDKNSDVLMIGMGTGIAPFRAFVRHIYETVGDWKGKVRLFYGAHTGLEMLYMNDKRDDFSNYYDEATFKAFQAVSSRPYWNEAIEFNQVLKQHEQEVWQMINKNNTHVFIAGLEQIRVTLDKIFSEFAGSQERWLRMKAELRAGQRWVELIYDD